MKSFLESKEHLQYVEDTIIKPITKNLENTIRSKPKKIILQRRGISESFTGFDKDEKYNIVIEYHFGNKFWYYIISKTTKRLGWHTVAREYFKTIEQAIETLRNFAENTKEPYNKTFEIVFENDEKGEIEESKKYIEARKIL